MRGARHAIAMGRAAEHEPICRAGANCWQLARAGRLAFLVDGSAYFEAFAAALERAQHSVVVVGWDVHSRVQLLPRRRRRRRALPSELAPFLNEVARRRPELRIHLLSWNFPSAIYGLEREFLPVVRLGWRTHERIRFRLDGSHPIGASHHQKIVVVDDALAFCGGIDLTAHRWDTPAHAPDDERRTTPAGHRYSAFHDVQLAVDGEAARALGELVRERWQRATGEALPPPPSSSDPWPSQLAPALRGIDVAIARTDPAYDDREEVREIERLFLDAIASARRRIYVECQYATAPVLSGALARRLSEPRGPEVVIVTTRECSGWIEEATMGALRHRFVGELREADRHGRLRVCHPVVGQPALPVNVHSKVLVVDERHVHVGSANLSNRSMGLDTECDLAVDAPDAEAERAIARFRNGLLAEHLGAPLAEVDAALASHGSLVRVVDELGSAERRLVPLDCSERRWVHCVIPGASLLDLERPIAAGTLLTHLASDDVISWRARFWLAAGALAALTGLVVAWGGL